MNSNDIRKLFLDYFKDKKHKIVKSSPLILHKDPTLLFTNAGMNQFKNIFLGLEQREYKRATSSQKCMRAGGKHNDLEQVGKTNRHHTFFEMLGNFSFGDYFKKEAINFAWELLVKKYKLSPEKLIITIYKDDEEAFDIWKNDIGVPENKIYRLGEKDNFWEMGETGPCGPCTEIHYDRGGKYGDYEFDEKEGERYVEIWNLVFMQYYRDEKGNLSPLPKPSIDTGMGLERLTSILQNSESNYETDLFLPIIRRIEEMTGEDYTASSKNMVAMRVISDHIRAITFLIGDGVLPSNEGRGYVLRRIIRRGYRYGKELGLNKPFLYKLSGVVIDIMKDAYPELAGSSLTISNICHSEEERFTKTLDIGYLKIKEIIKNLKDNKENKIDGKLIFKLYDTYGFPPDLAKDILEENRLAFDEDGFNRELKNQKDRARSFWKGDEKIKEIEKYRIFETEKTEFTGYEKLEDISEIVGIIKGSQKTEIIKKGEKAELIVEKTPFYAEAGGQKGDIGIIENDNFYAEVIDTQKPLDTLIVHKIKVIKGEIRKGDKVNLKVDYNKRWETMKNHTATHLLHKALREVLGEHVKQAGSLVMPEHLRFDFTHFKPLTREEIALIEEMVNGKIQETLCVTTEIMSIDEAVKTGAMAIFEEKYGDMVRVVSIGDFSKELCGGTHIKNTGEIGVFKILSENSISSGVRRIEAVTGLSAIKKIQENFDILEEVKIKLNSSKDKIIEQLEKIRNEYKVLEKKNTELRQKLISSNMDEIIKKSRKIKDINLIFNKVNGLRKEEMRTLADNLKNKLENSFVILVQEKEGKISIVFSLRKELTPKFKVKDIIKKTAKIIGGGGGGRDDFGEAGGSKPENLETFEKEIINIIENV
jgi:alanyl-tRNA synthetase